LTSTHKDAAASRAGDAIEIWKDADPEYIPAQ
jgi:hypothetical protein